MKDTMTTCTAFTPTPQHFPVIVSETHCGPAATIVNASGGNFRSTLVERLKLSPVRLFGHSPRHAAASNRISWPPDTLTTALDRHVNVLVC